MEQQIPSQQTGFVDNALSTVNKLESWRYKLKVIGYLITGIVLVLAGIILAIIIKSFAALLISVVGLLVILGSWLSRREPNPLFMRTNY